MRMLRLPTARPLALRFLRATVTSLTPFSFARLGLMELLPLRLGVGLPVSPQPLRFFPWRKPFGSLKFPGYPFVLLPCSRTPVGSPRQAFFLRRFDSAPAVQTTKAPTSSIISRLYHTAFAPLHTLRAAIADDYAMFASGWWPTFTGWAPRPTGSLLCVSESCFRFRLHDLPHILGLLDATELLQLLTS